MLCFYNICNISADEMTLVLAACNLCWEVSDAAFHSKKILISSLWQKCICQRSPALPLAQAKAEFCQGRVSSSLVWLNDCQCYTCGFVFTSATLPSRRAWRLRYEDNMSECVAKKTGVAENWSSWEALPQMMASVTDLPFFVIIQIKIIISRRKYYI